MFFINFKKHFNNKGFGIIEALIGITIGGLLLATFSTLIYQTIKINRVNASQIKATMYLQELIEVAKDLEQSATTTIFLPGPTLSCNNCYPKDSGGNTWTLVNVPPEPQLEGIFSRAITISPVSRDATNHEIETPYNFANDDPYTKLATATISWYDGSQNHTQKLETYLYYYGQ